MRKCRRLSEFLLKLIVAAALLFTAVATAGCWDDDCPEGCDAGYACYYGACLSRNLCPRGTEHSDDCAQYDEDNNCIQEVDHGICNTGFVCACTEYDPSTEECTVFGCVEATDPED